MIETSIVVPTYNRSRALANLLDSLHAVRSLDAPSVELFIVDNGSSDDTWHRLQEERSRFRRCAYVPLRETTQGKASAVNRGLRHATGSLLIVIDDDVIVSPDWLRGHIDAHKNVHFGAIQGRVLPGKDPNGGQADPARLREYNIPIVDHGAAFREIRGLTGTNISLKRNVCARVGYFDPRLGPGAAGFSEDTEYSLRVRRAGFRIGYAPEALVYHELDPERYGAGYNRRVSYRKGMSRSIYRHDPLLLKIVPDLFMNCLRLAFYRVLGKSQKAYKTESRIYKNWGYLVGKLRALRKGKRIAGDF